MNKIIRDYYEKSEGEAHLCWHDIEEAAHNIIWRMRRDNFEPDIIISIARSGMIPAALLSYATGNKRLYTIKIDFSKTQKQGKNQDLRHSPIITQELSKDIEGLNVLVVDEMVVSGATLKTVSTYLSMKNPKEIKYVVLYRQPWTQFEPDYYGEEIRQWPIFPWKRLKNGDDKTCN